MYVQPKTLLSRWETAQKEEPGIALRVFAMRNGMTEEVALARLDTARKERELRMQSIPAVQAGAVTTISFDAPPNWSQWFLFQSDNHHDSALCNRELEAEHLQEAVKRNAMIMIFGDLFDAMQGRFDPRRSMAELRPEYRVDSYYNKIVDDTLKFFVPYAANLALVADGNHELSVIKNASTDILGMFISMMNLGGLNVKRCGYGGWVRLVVNMPDKDKTIVKNVKYFHGSGGEAPVTRGAIQTNRQAVYLPDADIVVNGHSHNSYHIPISRERLSPDGRHYFDIQHHIRIPGYKQGYGDGSQGWEVTRGGVPKPIGAVWVRLRRNGDDITVLTYADIRGPDNVSLQPGDLYGGRVFDDDTIGQ